MPPIVVTAGRAEQMKVLAALILLRLANETGEFGRDIRHHSLEYRLGDFDAAEAFGQGHHADLERDPETDAFMPEIRVARGPPEPDNLRRAATDIKEDHRFRRRIGEGGATRRREMLLCLAIDDFKFETERVAHAGDEFRSVLRTPAGLGRNQSGRG